MTASEEKRHLRSLAASLPRPDLSGLIPLFLSLPQVEKADTVMIYCGVPPEPDTDPLRNALLAEGKRTAYPVCLPGRQLEVRAVTDREELSPGKYGIPEPNPLCPLISREEVDVVVVPCLLCDREGYRLGHGGGYYDRWLPGFQGFSVCLCPSERMVDHLPRDRFDCPVDLILTEGSAFPALPDP